MENRIQIEGTGIPIVLVHGMGGPKIWSPVVEKLKEKFMVIVPTFPGFLIEDGKIDYSDGLYVDFLIQVREFLNIEKWNVVGISMGGRTAINYGLREKNHISSLTLIDSIGVGYMSPILSLPLIKKVFPALIKGILANKVNRNKLAKQDFVNHDGAACKNCISWFNNLVGNKTVRSNFAEIISCVGIPQKKWQTKLNKLDMPSQILWASDDKTAPVQWGEWLNKKIPRSEFKVLNGYKHMAILERPDFFIDLIVDFATSKSYVHNSK